MEQVSQGAPSRARWQQAEPSRGQRTARPGRRLEAVPCTRECNRPGLSTHQPAWHAADTGLPRLPVQPWRQPQHKAGTGGGHGQGWGLLAPRDTARAEQAATAPAHDVSPGGCRWPTPTEEQTPVPSPGAAPQRRAPGPAPCQGMLLVRSPERPAPPAPRLGGQGGRSRESAAEGFAPSQFQSHPTGKMPEILIFLFLGRMENLMPSSYAVLAGHLTTGH